MKPSTQSTVFLWSCLVTSKHTDSFYRFTLAASRLVKRQCRSLFFSLNLISKAVLYIYSSVNLQSKTYLAVDAQNSTRPKPPGRLLSGHWDWDGVCVRQKHGETRSPRCHHSGREDYDQFCHVCRYEHRGGTRVVTQTYSKFHEFIFHKLLHFHNNCRQIVGGFKSPRTMPGNPGRCRVAQYGLSEGYASVYACLSGYIFPWEHQINLAEARGQNHYDSVWPQDKWTE